MGATSRVLLVLCRLGELVCGAVVLGLLGQAFSLINDAGVLEPEGRLIYTAVVASLTMIDSLIFIVPFAYSYWSFLLDFILFVLWIVAFGLLESALQTKLTGIHTCSSFWFNYYWGYYWGRWYVRGPPGMDINWTGCNAWRTVLAFSFIASMIYLANGFLGVYWTLEYGNIRTRSKGFFERKRGLGGDTSGGSGHLIKEGGPGVTQTPVQHRNGVMGAGLNNAAPATTVNALPVDTVDPAARV
ncbi:hypothetical protein QC761_0047500 [Podospora bellae-mahoneyi]|uniref:MARVEL domain-containing protein n=1 Tax=Podospora bellae-mahoneyi TaxID=2093777 RepID=A0ABR0FJQ3_9PEZI|nr:hypothetical protein QC761_0047500 [Podospora bellae-mahoneyi]